MDRTKLESLITENMKSVFGFALTRLGNINEAEDLASDILYKILCSADSLKDEERFFGFMWKIAENTYMDYLRKKSRNAGRITELDETVADDADSALDTIIRTEDLNLLRRELSLLSRQYREATVLYYMENLSCSEIATKLQISTEMVKYYLFRARKIIREGMDMERIYGEKSYRPGGFAIDYWGDTDLNSNEYEEFKKRKIKGNILLAAYYSPVTIQEIAIELGVALPYLEDEIKLLTDRHYLTCENGKYLTNIPIFTEECTSTLDTKLKDLTEDTAKKLVAIADEFYARFGNRFACENLARWQKVLLCVHFALIKSEDALKNAYGVDGARTGVVWGQSFKAVDKGSPARGIQGIYNGVPSLDGRGTAIAINFFETLNAQHFEHNLTDPVVCTAVDCYEYLPREWQDILTDLGYARDCKANFAVWTKEEYNELETILGESISLITEFSRKTAELAAAITADLAPAHIRKTAEYVGAIVYRFNSIENLVDSLFRSEWLRRVNDNRKPAVCVVKH